MTGRRAVAALVVCLVMAALGGLWGVSIDRTPPLAAGEVQRLGRADMVASPRVTSQTPPPGADAGWQATVLPLVLRAAATAAATPGDTRWVRLRFDLPQAPAGHWGVYLPYLAGGGAVWLNGQPLAAIAGSSALWHVRWERPHLVPVPQGLLHTGANELVLQALSEGGESRLMLPAPQVGPLDALRAVHDNRFFWVRTMPQLTVAACLAVSAFVLLAWSRLPEETLYGWFGLAVLLWGVRTLTFVLETVPADRWELWRLVYLASTGGFVVVMTLFALHLAGLRRRWLDVALLTYWLAGPAWLLWQGIDKEPRINELWSGALMPLGLATVALSGVSVWRQRTLTSLLLPAGLVVATACGIHDYLMAWHPGLLEPLLPGWTGERYFLLHHGANLLLVAMGVMLSIRFVGTARSLRELNQTLESRIADREQSLADNYLRLAELERQQAAAEERQLIMREIHDGLGSQLFTSLSRVERGAMDRDEMAAALRGCIADMRLALDALAPQDHDLATAFGDFMFRWQAELEAAGLRCTWDIALPDETLRLPAHQTLQLLRVAQEALTNVAKHAQANAVRLTLAHADGALRLLVEDDGIGLGTLPGSSGRGLPNMRSRAAHLGGTLAVEPGAGRGTRVVLTVPLPATSAPAAVPATALDSIPKPRKV